jgi:hypothetical protein
LQSASAREPPQFLPRRIPICQTRPSTLQFFRISNCQESSARAEFALPGLPCQRSEKQCGGLVHGAPLLIIKPRPSDTSLDCASAPFDKLNTTIATPSADQRIFFAPRTGRIRPCNYAIFTGRRRLEREALHQGPAAGPPGQEPSRILVAAVVAIVAATMARRWVCQDSENNHRRHR